MSGEPYKQVHDGLGRSRHGVRADPRFTGPIPILHVIQRHKNITRAAAYVFSTARVRTLARPCKS